MATTPQPIHVFDFDGTLTTTDTLLAFIRHARGPWRMALGFALHAPLLVLMKLGLYPNGKAKERLFAFFFKGMSIEAFDRACQRFAHDTQDHLLRPLGREAVRQALARGERVLVVSASIDNWVRPFFDGLVPTGAANHAARIEVLGTQVETADGHLTGRFATPNCYGAEKVRRIREALPLPRHQYHITAYGDSRGDKQMLDDADEAHYRPFRP